MAWRRRQIMHMGEAADGAQAWAAAARLACSARACPRRVHFNGGLAQHAKHTPRRACNLTK